MSELMAQFEQITKLEGEAAVQAVMLEGLVDRISALEEMMLALGLVKVDDRGVLVMKVKRRGNTTPSLPVEAQ